ncbi:hypothetical protein NEMIN01_1699 [Nematocida minor]|uniref:uncharacterized protein n=1 Tax=Nematocida minor TaxID=1912983 RepID=UPI00221E8D5C|nr:uncharacterized protein NEMIN01_1699 [Nematocida minor]KAI5191844.1 hypothetical protein NEMIN01_1699 [Nematocida minor]
MDRTEEYRRNSLGNSSTHSFVSNKIDNNTNTFLNIAKDLRVSLNTCYSALAGKRGDYLEVEKTVKELSKESNRVIELLQSLDEVSKFLEGVIANIRTAVKKTEIKLEERKSKKLRPSLNIALEPERSTPTVKTKPVMMQILQEENVRILERVRCTEREIVQIRRKVSEIDILQKLITQELYIQDERIDIILHNTSAASVDVKISRTYIKNAGEKKKVAKRFISLFIMILSIVLLILHYLNK